MKKNQEKIVLQPGWNGTLSEDYKKCDIFKSYPTLNRHNKVYLRKDY